MIRSTALSMIHAVGWLVAGFAVMAGMAAWRLSAGPVPLTLLTPYLGHALDAAAGAAGDLRTAIGDTVMDWGGVRHPLELRALDVRVVARDGHVVATVPEVAIGISLRALALGRLALTRVTVIRPSLRLERTTDGRLTLEIHGPGGAGSPPALPVVVAPEAGGGPGPVAGILDVLGRPPDPQDGRDPLGALTELSVAGAELALVDRVTGASWSAPRVDLSARRGADGTSGQARVELALDGRTAVIEAGGHAAGRAGTGWLRLRDLDPGALAPLVPALASLSGVRSPLSGRLAASFDGDRVRLDDAEFKLDGGAVIVTASGAAVLGARDGGLHLAIRRGGRTATLAATLSGPTATLSLADLEPALFATLAPALEPLAAAAFPVGGTATVALDGDGRPERLTLDLAAGPGNLVPPAALMPEPVPLRGLTLKLTVERPLDPVPERLDIAGLTVDFGGPGVSVEGVVARAGERLTIKGGVKAHAVPAEMLPKLWPPAVGKNARDWITKNIIAGMVDDAWISVDGSAPVADPSDILATTLDGGVDASNLTVSYFKTLPPITGISGHGTSDGRDFILHTTGGRVLDLAVGDARIDISKLDTPQEWIDIDAPLSGSLRSALTVLDTPPLRYAHRVEIDPAKTEGNQTTRLRFYFPLKKGIDIETVEIHADAALHGAAIQGLAGGLDASDGELKLVLDNAGMDVTGTARLEGLPAAVRWRENFPDEADPGTKVSVKAEIGEADFAKRGLRLAPYVGGKVGADIELVVDRRKRTRVTGALDLAPARLALPELEWLKAPGAPGGASFGLEFDRGKPVRVSDITVDAGGLKVAGFADLNPVTGGFARLMLTDLRLGASNVQADLRVRPDGGYDIAVHGASLDARPVFRSPDDPEVKRRRHQERVARRAAPRPPGPRYDLSLQLGRLMTADGGRALTDVLLKLRDDGVGWDTAELNARIAGSTATLSLGYRPEAGKRRLTAATDDAGALLRALDVTDSVRGGRLRLSGLGEPGVPARPVTGQVELEDYRVVGAPLLARILNALSVTGLIELLQGEGLTFSQAAGDVTWGDDLITLGNVRTSGGALGLTAGGKIDLAAGTLALEGTIVPLYGLNRVVGMIPLLGDLLSGGAGQGIFAATYDLSGSADDPAVSVNPLAALAPGFLRNLFFLK